MCAIEHTLCILPSERSTSATSCFKLQSQAGLLRTTLLPHTPISLGAPPQAKLWNAGHDKQLYQPIAYCFFVSMREAPHTPPQTKIRHTHRTGDAACQTGPRTAFLFFSTTPATGKCSHSISFFDMGAYHPRWFKPLQETSIHFLSAPKLRHTHSRSTCCFRPSLSDPRPSAWCTLKQVDLSFWSVSFFPG